VALDLPGRQRDIDQLLATYADMAGAGGRGRTVFVAGDVGSGRTALLHGLAGELVALRPRPVVLAGGFEDGRYVPWGDSERESRVMAVLEPAVSLAQGVHPIVGLVGQVLSMSKAAQRLLKTLSGQADRPDPSVLVGRLMEELCEQGPVALLVDDADQAGGGWWADLVLSFAPRISRGLPLLLVLTVEGPQDLGAHQDDEPDSLFVARRLRARDLATCHPLASLTVEELERWTGPATQEVLRSLVEVTAGRAELSAQLWSEWCRRDVVVEDERDGRWRFAEGGHARALDPVGEVLGDRLKRLIGATDVKTLDRTRELLACAALEGRRFTADATAAALGREGDELIDFLDDTLTGVNSRPAGVLTETGSVDVSDERGERHLWLYRFRSELDWLTLFHHGLTPRERSVYSLRLAEAIESLYGGQAHLAAHTLTRLFEDGEDPARALRYRRMGDIGVNRAVILWRARKILAAPEEPEDRAERRRGSQILLAAARELFDSGPFDEGLAFARAGQLLAPLKTDQAFALHLAANHRIMSGYYDAARADLAGALKLARELHLRQREAAARHDLALLDLIQRNHDAARAEFTNVVELCREIGDHQGEAQALTKLARIDLEQGAFDRARDQLTGVIDRCRELGNRRIESEARYGLARVELAQGAHDRARSQFKDVLALRRELQDRHGEGQARRGLADVDLEQGAYDRARAQFTDLVALSRELRDRSGEALALQGLGRVELEQGEDGRARHEFNRMLELCRELGDHQLEAAARDQLARLDEAAAG
jgi:tetratricopeptide (TPR) repeat protein